MSKIDIIALAKEAGFSASGNEIFLVADYTGIIDATYEINALHTLLEAEIRKEYENELEVEKVNGSMQFDLINDLKAKLSALTEQNTKLMEALALILPMAKGYAAERWVGSNQKYIEIAEDALTPQPENREE